MTPENDDAQERALEALIAASLRPPGHLAEITDDEIGRFLDQNVTLAAEDEVALARVKPKLKLSFAKILNENQEAGFSDACASAFPVKREIHMPRSLLTLGQREGLRTGQLSKLLNMRLEIIGRRSDEVDDDLEAFDWQRFYHKVKEYLI